MRNSFDWTPYRRSTVGFDRLFDFLETGGSGAENYPPFDIEKIADDHFRITVAVATRVRVLRSQFRIGRIKTDFMVQLCALQAVG